VFFGTHTPRLDEKGRIFLPAKFRDEMGDSVVITAGQDRCLFVWPATEFRALTEQLRTAPMTNKRVRDFVRMFFSTASNEAADKQGRITIPPLLRQYAGLQRDCVAIGAMNRVEIWDPAAWRVYSRDQETAFSELSEEVLPGVI
jgi:MraZ protein